MRLTKLQTEILEQLAAYTYLTNSQLAGMGLGHIKTVSRLTKMLSMHPSTKTPALGVLRPGKAGRIEGQENILHLTPYGAVILSEALGADPITIPFPLAPAFYERDYWHRKHCIDFQILLTGALRRQFAEVLTLQRFDRYFDKSGANRRRPVRERLRSLTRADLPGGSYIIPDATFMLAKADDAAKRLLFCLEMTHQRDTKRVLEQVDQHARALETGAVAEKYGMRQGHRVLCLFSEKPQMDAVIGRLGEIKGFEGFTRNFLFACREEVERGVIGAWRTAESSGRVHMITGKPLESPIVGASRPGAV